MIALLENVAIYETESKEYPQTPFNPPKNFPEYPFKGELQTDNEVYTAIRNIFNLLGMDSRHYGSAVWNPLGELIKSGDNVVIKPNLLYHYHPEGRLDAIIVHGSILRAVIDYVFIALKKKGKITVAESPVWQADFKKILDLSGISEMAEYLRGRGVEIGIVDMRETMFSKSYDSFKLPEVVKLEGDPTGYQTVDLGEGSEFHGLVFDLNNYRNSMTDKIKNENVCTYRMPKTILSADVIINLSKLKTHVMAGNTLSLKNIVGTYGEKIDLPHYRTGTEICDEHPRFSGTKALKQTTVKKLYKFFKKYPFLEKMRPVKNFVLKVTDERWKEPFPLWGCWYGNDTVWRMTLDLNKILLYASKEGKMEKTRQRKVFAIIDGIISGEDRGPIRPKERNDGIIIAGNDFVATDLVATRLMGFDHYKIPILRKSLESKGYSLTNVKVEEIKCNSNKDKWKKLWELKKEDLLNFEPPLSWRGHIEL